MTAALLITVGLFIVFSGFALGTFVIGAVVGHWWSVNDYSRNKAHQRDCRSVALFKLAAKSQALNEAIAQIEECSATRSLSYGAVG